MQKAMFNRLVDALKGSKRGFTRLMDNPAGSKLVARCKPESKRGADGTMRR